MNVLKYLRNLEDRKEQVISAISDQGKMTAELGKTDPGSSNFSSSRRFIPPIQTKTPYKSYDRREKGLESLANVIHFTEI